MRCSSMELKTGVPFKGSSSSFEIENDCHALLQLSSAEKAEA